MPRRIYYTYLQPYLHVAYSYELGGRVHTLQMVLNSSDILLLILTYPSGCKLLGFEFLVISAFFLWIKKKNKKEQKQTKNQQQEERISETDGYKYNTRRIREKLTYTRKKNKKKTINVNKVKVYKTKWKKHVYESALHSLLHQEVKDEFPHVSTWARSVQICVARTIGAAVRKRYVVE